MTKISSKYYANSKIAFGDTPFLKRKVNESINKKIEDAKGTDQSLVLYISGEAGIGKSTMINSLESIDLIFSGKYEQFQKSTRDHALFQIIEAVGNHDVFLKYIEDQDHFGMIKNALTPYGHILEEVAPSWAKIFNLHLEGDSEKLVIDVVNQNVNLINIILDIIAKAFPQKLVLVIEDLHWLEPINYDAWKSVFDADHNIIWICTSRMKYHESIDFPCESFHIDSFSREEIEDYMSILFSEAAFDTKVLAEVMWEQSNGNPYLVSELLLHLERIKKIYKLGKKWNWEYSIKDLFTQNNTISRIYKNKLKLIDDQTRIILNCAACFGASVNAVLISKITNFELPEIHEAMDLLIETGFLKVDTTDSYIEREKPISFGFYHDLVKEAVLEEMDSNERMSYHKDMAFHYSSQKILDSSYPLLFDALYHINLSCTSDAKEIEKLNHFKYNTLGMDKSLKSANFRQAKEFLEQALKFNMHESNHIEPLVLRNMILKGYQIGRITKDDGLSHRLFLIGEERLNGLSFQRLQLAEIVYDVQFGFLEKAMVSGISLLKDLGVNVPKKANGLHVGKELIKSRWILRKMSENDIKSLPKLKDDKMDVVFEVIYWLMRSAQNINPSLNGVLALKQLQLTLKLGLNREAYTGFLAYGVIIGVGMNNHEEALKMCEMGVEIATLQNNQSGVLEFGKSVYLPLKIPISEAMEYATRAKEMNYSSGAYISASEPTVNESMLILASGKNLSEVKELVSDNLAFCQRLKMKDFADFQSIMLENILKLKGEDVSSDMLQYNRETLGSTQFKIIPAYHGYLSALNKVHSGDWEEASIELKESRKYFQSLAGLFSYSEVQFITIVVKLMVGLRENKNVGSIMFNRMVKNYLKLARFCPVNHEHKMVLINAIKTFKKDKDRAMSLLNKASELSLKRGFLNDTVLIKRVGVHLFKEEALTSRHQQLFDEWKN